MLSNENSGNVEWPNRKKPEVKNRRWWHVNQCFRGQSTRLEQCDCCVTSGWLANHRWWHQRGVWNTVHLSLDTYQRNFMGSCNSSAFWPNLPDDTGSREYKFATTILATWILAAPWRWTVITLFQSCVRPRKHTYIVAGISLLYCVQAEICVFEVTYFWLYVHLPRPAPVYYMQALLNISEELAYSLAYRLYIYCELKHPYTTLVSSWFWTLLWTDMSQIYNNVTGNLVQKIFFKTPIRKLHKLHPHITNQQRMNPEFPTNTT